MINIYKYALKVADSQDVNMPHGATILTAQMQGESLCMWAAVSPDKSIGQRRISIVGTGHPYDEALTGEYVASVQAGPFVWHVFDAGYCA